MQAGTALIGRRLLAAFVAVMLMASVMLLFAESPARADHVDTWPASAASNDASFWEQWGEDNEGEDDWSCVKTDNPNDDGTPYELGDPPAGTFWRLLVVKAGNDHNDLYWNPVSGEEYAATGQGAGGWSHVIECSRPIPTTTTTEAEETTTTEAEETTTTVEDTTTTTVEDTTTTTIEDEVLPTVITTSTTAAPATTVEDEVLGTEVLPFTGGDNDMLALLAGGLGLLGALVLASTRRMEEN